VVDLRARAPRLPLNRDDAGVHPLELFFDLVFVFALTQVTALMAAESSGAGLVRGVLLLGLLWWSWVGYAWLCNVVRSDAGVVPLILLGAMAAMFVLALSIPEAFDDLPGGLHGPVVLAVCYFLFRLMHLTIFWLVSAHDPQLRRQVLRFAPSVAGGTVLLLVAAGTDGTTQTLLWAAALAADYLGTFLGGSRGWRIQSVGHFAERHGLILIVALGESIVAIGVGVAQLPVSVPVVVASVLGLGLASGLWWLYFDWSSSAVEHAFASESAEKRAAFARDVYSYLHALLLIGVVMAALGMKKVLEYVADSTDHELSDALSTVPAVALLGGAALYLVGNASIELRALHEVVPTRLVGAFVLVLLLPFGDDVPALVCLAMTTGVVAGVAVTETVLFAERRRPLHRADPIDLG
jgi:low temperature requirement protein LtrA